MAAVKFLPNYNTIAQTLKAEMAKRKITQKDLSKRMGVSQPTLSNRLNHASDFTVEDLVRATGVLGVSITIEKGNIIIN